MTDAIEQTTDETTPEATAPVEKTPRRKAPLIAAGLGVVGLLLGAGGGYLIGHDSASATTSAGSTAALALPSTLSGGYQRSSAVDTQLKSAVSSATTALGAGTDMALYAKGNTQVLVEATRLPGSALLQAGFTYSKVGDAVCASSASSSGSEAVCSRSGDALTVKVTAATADVASRYADELYTSLA